MMKLIFTVVFLSFFTSMPLFAFNMQFLRYSPISHFTSEDFEFFNAASENALENNKDGQTSEWKNPKTTHSGSVTPLNTKTLDGKTCRQLKIVNQARNQYGESIFTFCKIDNEWKVVE